MLTWTIAGTSSSKSGVSEERLFEVTLEAGADDLKDLGETFEVTCPADAYFAVTEALQQASYKLAEAVYAQAQAQPGPGQGQPGATTTTDQGTTTQADGDVVDAEIIDEGDQDQQKGA